MSNAQAIEIDYSDLLRKPETGLTTKDQGLNRARAALAKANDLSESIPAPSPFICPECGGDKGNRVRLATHLRASHSYSTSQALNTSLTPKEVEEFCRRMEAENENDSSGQA